MWPKVFAQLVELLPHISRLIPMADVFFATKTAGEKANEAAFSALAKDVRADLTGVTSSHESLYRQLQDQSGQIAQLESEARRARVAVEEQVVRAAELQKQLGALGVWIKAAVALLALTIVLLIVILLRSR